MKLAILFCLFCGIAFGGLFDEKVLEYDFTEGVSYDVEVYKSDPVTVTFHLTKEDVALDTSDANSTNSLGAMFQVRMTTMSYRRRIHVAYKVGDDNNTKAIKNLITGNGLNPTYMYINKADCLEGCDIKATFTAECDKTCLRSITTRMSAHLVVNKEVYYGHTADKPVAVVPKCEWSAEVEISRDTIDKPLYFVYKNEESEKVQLLFESDRYDDGDDLVIVSGGNDNKEPSLTNRPEWVMITQADYQYVLPGKNYIGLCHGKNNAKDTIGRFRVCDAASSLLVSLATIVCIIALIF